MNRNCLFHNTFKRKTWETKIKKAVTKTTVNMPCYMLWYTCNLTCCLFTLKLPPIMNALIC